MHATAPCKYLEHGSDNCVTLTLYFPLFAPVHVE